MQEEFGEKVHAVSVDLDHDAEGAPPAELVARVKAKLVKLGLATDNVVCADPCTATLKALGVFGLPAVLVYDRAGRLAKTFQGRFTYADDVVPLVKELAGPAR